MNERQYGVSRYVAQQRSSNTPDDTRAMMEEARRQGLFVHASPELTTLLVTLNTDRRVPAVVYDTLGEVLNWLHSLDQA